MTVKTLGDFIEEDKRGTKGLQREGIDDPEFRKSASSVFYPHTTLSQNRLRFGNDINLFSLATFEEFYSKLRFKSVEDSEAVFSPTGESSANTLFWKPERSLQWPATAKLDESINEAYGENKDSLSAALKSVFDLYTQNLQLEGPFQNQILTGKEPIDSDLSKGLEDLLNAKNRFNPGPNSPFYDSSTRQITGNGTTFVYANSAVLRDADTVNVQGEFGKYNPDKIPRTLNDIRRYAVSNLIAATGHTDKILNSKTKDLGEFNSDISGIQFDPLAHGQSSLPFMDKIGLDKMGIAPTSLINNDGGTEDANQGDDDSRNRNSFGQMNSPAEPFHGPFNMGMIMPALFSLLLIFVLLYIFKVFVDLINKAGAAASFSLSPADKPLKAKDVKHILDAKEEIFKYRFGENTAVTSPDLFSKDFFSALLYIIKDALDWPFWQKYNFFLNSFRGLLLFLGFSVKFGNDAQNSGEREVDEILPALLGLMKNPGYFAVISKQVMREFDNIGNAFSSLGDIGSLASAISNILSVFEAIRESTTWRFILVLSNMGEQAARATLDSTNANWTGGNGAAHRHKNITPSADMNVLRSQHRVGANGEFTSAISLTNFSSLLLSNQQFDKANEGIVVLKSQPSAVATEDNNIYGSMDDQNAVRIPKEVVQKYEELLNSEYCPFYIQDLRNNEIVNIPAFISSLSDNFSPEYSSTDGYGRTDPVRVYTKTTRQIQIGFKMVAMNEGDHNKMWFSINRLIAMLYPQRSVGRLVKGKEGSQFIQPFSSVPTTSPLVRLRLGDLYRTNFSDSSFGRLLGLNQGKIIPPGVNLTEEEKKSFAKSNSEFKNAIKAKKAAVQDEFNAIVIDTNKNGETKLKETQAIIKKYTDKENPKFEGAVIIRKGTPLRLKAVEPSPGGLLGAVAGAVGGLIGGGPKPEENDTTFTSYQKKHVYGKLIGVFANENTLYAAIHTNIFEDKTIETLIKDLENQKKAQGDKFNLDKAYLAEIAKRASAGVDFNILNSKMSSYSLGQDEIKAAFLLKQNKPKGKLCFVVPFIINGEPAIKIVPHYKKLLDSLEGNESLQAAKKILKRIQDVQTPMEYARQSPFYRSFRENAGYGLAGVITQFSLDYGDSTWEIKEGSKAPKKVDVTMSFEPIHDLTPGLDTNGRMMNPTFPVGESSGGHKNPWIQESSIENPSATATAEELQNQLLGVPKDEEPAGFPGNLF